LLFYKTVIKFFFCSSNNYVIKGFVAIVFRGLIQP
jgi:hypothetical protein